MAGSPIKKALLITAGSISLALGLSGIILPLLPTTPFLLLSAFCYFSSSKRLYNWLINHKVFGSYLYDYITYRAVRRTVKIGALLFLWLTLLVSFLLVPNLYARIGLTLVGAAVSTHLLTLKTAARDPCSSSNESAGGED